MKTFLKTTILASGLALAMMANAQVIDEGERGGVSKTTLITTGAVVDETGKVVVWGFRGSGQQGNGKMVVPMNAPPARVESISDINYLTAGAYHLIALDALGNVYGWGQSGFGETGCPGFYVSTPCQVMSGVRQIAAGEYFSLALKWDGDVYAFGHNLYGQLGDGTSKNTGYQNPVPVKVNLNGEKARLIGGAYEGGFAVTEEGHVWAWGDNEASGLGFQGTIYGVQQIIRTPRHVTNLDPYAADITYIAGGNGWGEALLNDGRVIAWGLRAGTGWGTNDLSKSSPEPYEVMNNVEQLFARYVGSFALTRDGLMYTWGQTAGTAFPMVYGYAPHLRYQYDRTDPVVGIGGNKEDITYVTRSGRIYGVGFNDLYKLNQSALGGIIDWPGSEIHLDP